ncbi:MAG: LamG domain-containing protein [Candidatus Aminicenantes bacterium]|nr:LamG domain-containing protein [Candidatus Aminicenantes bacterium]
MTSPRILSRKNVLFLATLAFIARIGTGRPASVSVSGPLPVPVVHWTFDAPESGAAKDVIGNIKDVIRGHYTEVKGVTGHAVRLDGYTFCLERPGKQVPALGPSFTVDAWIAQAAYPWNWAPVVTQLKEGVNGFYFGVGPRGQFGMDITINDEQYRCVSDDFVLPLRQWSHIAAVVRSDEGVTLYLNGRPDPQP